MEGGNNSCLYLVGIIIILILLPVAGLAAIVPIGMLPYFRGEQGNGPNSNSVNLIGEGGLGPVSGLTGMAEKSGYQIPDLRGKAVTEMHLGNSLSDTPDLNSAPEFKWEVGCAGAGIGNSRPNRRRAWRDIISGKCYNFSVQETDVASTENMPAGGRWGFGHSSAEEKWYCNMRWSPNADWWKGQKILVKNTATGKQLVCSAQDWGPAGWTGNIIGLSPEASSVIGAGADVEVSFAP